MRTLHSRHTQGASARKAVCRRRLAIESLETRNLMTASLGDDGISVDFAVPCQCPVCSGIGLDEIPVVGEATGVTGTGTTSTSSTSYTTSLPRLSSNSGAAKKLYLDFGGHYEASWGTARNVITPAFDQDGRPATYSSGEIAAITEIWTRVAEDYAPFNIDVTTIDPGTSSGVARVAIGGHFSDWYGSSAGGVAYVGGFTNSLPSVAYVFAEALGNGNPRYVAEAASHEAGHLFGLQHQAVWSGSQLVEPYHTGTSNWAPIMGTGYHAERTTWHAGFTSLGPASRQDDMAILASRLGWRADDYGNTTATAAVFPAIGSSVSMTGIIGTPSDLDMWSFTTGGGAVTFQLSGAAYGSNLDAVLELRSATGQTIASANPSSSLGASLSTSLAGGTYYVVARSSGGYGNVGQYTLRGTVPPKLLTTSSVPDVGLLWQGIALADGSALSLGTTAVGSTVSKTFTVKNQGKSTLSLQPISASSLPAGFTLSKNLSTTSLAPGQSTTFSVAFRPTSAGSFAGQISLKGSSNWSGLTLRLSATASGTLAAPVPTPNPSTGTSTNNTSSQVKRILDNGAAGHTRSGSWTRVSNQGFEKDLDRAAKGTGTSSSTWSFPSLPNGTYQVFGTWNGASTQATNAPFTLYNGSTPVSTVKMNQRVASSGVSADGANWKLLGTVKVTGGRLNVRLSNAANGQVVADAIRIVRTATAAELPEESPLPMAASPTAAAGALTSDAGLLAWLTEEAGSTPTLLATETTDASPAEALAERSDEHLLHRTLRRDAAPWTMPADREARVEDDLRNDSPELAERLFADPQSDFALHGLAAWV
jgi:hypothetical protein